MATAELTRDETEAATPPETATDKAAAEMILLAVLLTRFTVHLHAVAERRLAAMEEALLASVALADFSRTRRYRLAEDLAERALELSQSTYRDIRADWTAELLDLIRLVADFIAAQVDQATAPGTAKKPSEIG